MNRYEVRFRPRAEKDLFELYEFIAADRGDPVAESYIDRIEAVCSGLERLPNRGVRRDDIRLGLRTMSFERRATIVYHVGNGVVTIIRIFHSGQDYERILRGE
jgi:toxin ParE1/3/4